MRFGSIFFAICLASAVQQSAAAVERIESGTRIAENIPPVPQDLKERLQRYGNTRATMFAGWIADGSGMLVSTRFGSTTQIHWVKSAGGARTQLTFYDKPVTSVAVHPKRNGFVFGKDNGGSEFYA